MNETATVELARGALATGVERFVFANTNLVYGPGHGNFDSYASDELTATVTVPSADWP